MISYSCFVFQHSFQVLMEFNLHSPSENLRAQTHIWILIFCRTESSVIHLYHSHLPVELISFCLHLSCLYMNQPWNRGRVSDGHLRCGQNTQKSRSSFATLNCWYHYCDTHVSAYSGLTVAHKDWMKENPISAPSSLAYSFSWYEAETYYSFQSLC